MILFKFNFQVCHWLLGINMEHQVPKFIEHSVEGGDIKLNRRENKSNNSI